MAGDSVNIHVQATTAQAQRAFRDLKGEVAGLKGTLIPLATAAAPIAATMGAVAVKAAGATTALAAFGVAAAGQVGNLSDAAKAQDKYTDAVSKYGRGSEKAAAAQLSWQRTMAGMPQATARAATALATLKDDFHAWSDSLAGFTMSPVEKSFALMGQLLPRLTPMVEGASTQLDRLVTVAGGAITTPGLDHVADKLSSFANQSLKDAVDGIIHFSRVLSEGQGNGAVQTFMEFAEKNGPAVKETLRNLGEAVMTLVEASADAGPGMLSLVNAALKLVGALPPDLVATVMQLAVAFKTLKLAGAGIAVLATGVQALGANLAAMQAASAAAGGGLSGLSAAFGTLSRSAKIALISSGIGILVVALSQLSEMGKKAPADVDKMSESLRSFTMTGKVSGEAARIFGSDLSGFADSLQKIKDPKGLDQVQQSIVSFFGTDSTPVKEAKENIDGLDKALASLVKSGQADLAASALDTLVKRMKDQGFSSDDIRGQLDDYKSALADMKFEQELAIQSLGVFGQAAADTSAKLEAQKNAADGLRQSILALNDVNRSAYDAQLAFEQGLDDLTESFKKNGATLNDDTEAGRKNGEAMSAAAKAHDEMIAASIAAGDSLGSMMKKSDELRSSMMRLATEAFDGNTKKAQEFVNTLLGTPESIKTLVKAETSEAIRGLKDVQTEITKTPGAKEVHVSTLNGAAIAALEAVGLKTKQLPDGKTAVYTANGQALGSISAVAKALKNLNGQVSRTFTYHTVETRYAYSGKPPSSGKSRHEQVGATGGLYTGRGFRYASGGLVQGPGTGTSDDVFAPWLSNGEFVIKAAAVQKYGEKFLQRLNDGQIDMPRMAGGGKVSDAERQARAGLRGSMGVSGFGRMAGYSLTSFEKGLTSQSDMGGLVAALNSVRGQIQAATHGSTESRLLRQLDGVGKGLIKYERQLYSVNKALDGAKSKLNDLKSSASQLSNTVRSGILTSSNITRGANNGQPVTVATVMAGLTASRDKATSFASALKGLRSKGLRSDLLQQIAEAGTEGGGLETAGALLRASSSEIRSLNGLQGQIVSAAGAAGATTADAVYGAAIKAQNQLVSKLQKSQDKLERAMLNLAKTMEKAISSAIGRKAAGGIVGAAASGGVRSGLTWVGEHEPELLDLPSGARVWSNPDSRRMQRQAWASMLNTGRGSRAAAPAVQGRAAGGVDRPIVIQLTIGNRDLGEVLIEPLRQTIHHRGGVVQAVLGKRL
ncbi:phage tail protein [Streptomyces griseosporeus]